jgi:hypothetical protein
MNPGFSASWRGVTFPRWLIMAHESDGRREVTAMISHHLARAFAAVNDQPWRIVVYYLHHRLNARSNHVNAASNAGLLAPPAAVCAWWLLYPRRPHGPHFSNPLVDRVMTIVRHQLFLMCLLRTFAWFSKVWTESGSPVHKEHGANRAKLPLVALALCYLLVSSIGSP